MKSLSLIIFLYGAALGFHFPPKDILPDAPTKVKDPLAPPVFDFRYEFTGGWARETPGANLNSFIHNFGSLTIRLITNSMAQSFAFIQIYDGKYSDQYRINSTPHNFFPFSKKKQCSSFQPRPTTPTPTLSHTPHRTPS